MLLSIVIEVRTFLAATIWPALFSGHFPAN